MEILRNIPEELLKLLIVIALSIVISVIIVLPVIFWRIIRKKPIIPKGEKIESPNIFYIGIAVFGGFGILAFITGMPYHGIVILIFMCAYLAGLYAYKKGWRG